MSNGGGGGGASAGGGGGGSSGGGSSGGGGGGFDFGKFLKMFGFGGGGDKGGASAESTQIPSDQQGPSLPMDGSSGGAGGGGTGGSGGSSGAGTTESVGFETFGPGNDPWSGGDTAARMAAWEKTSPEEAKMKRNYGGPGALGNPMAGNWSNNPEFLKGLIKRGQGG